MKPQAFLVSVSLFLALPRVSVAQADPCLDGPESCYGNFAGPYTLSLNTPCNAAVLSEITHAIYLPPRWTNGAAQSHPFVGKAMLIVNPGCVPPSNYPETVTFVWDPASPSSIFSSHRVGNTMARGLWCGGHAILPSGDVVVGGGTNLPCTQCGSAPRFYGSTGVFLWNSTLGNTTSCVPGWSFVGDMIDPRWYPTFFELGIPTGDPLIVGHYECPNVGTSNPPCPGPGSPCYSTAVPPWTNQLYSNLAVLNQNVLVDAACNPTTTPPTLVALPGYAWMHQALTGACFQSGPDDVNKYFTRICGTSTNSWMLAGQTSPGNERLGGNSVHRVNLQGPPQESIYLIGGEDSSAMAPSTGCTALVTNSVVRMDNPAPGQPWVSLPPMGFSRKQCNTVPLPDGTLAVMGGIGWDSATSACVGRLHPEIFTPGGTPAWATMATHRHARSSHSVAFLLIDGRVVIAGGQGAAARSIEIFSPPYLFKGARPSIASAPQGISAMSGPATFPIVVNGGEVGDAPAMVTLVRPASVTHAFDQNQRFVRLAFQVTQTITPCCPAGPSEYWIDVTRPTSHAQTPPGWYMMFVVSAQGIPSVGAWLHID